MPVRLNVRQVREALTRVDSPGDGEPSHAALGRIFHETFADLIAEARNSGSLGRPERLTRQAYERTIGPYLSTQEGALQARSAEVANLWQAVESLADWLATIDSAAPIIETEQPVIAELRDPSWTDSVVLGGIADAIVREPSTDRWCVVELKLGRSHPRADLAQAALYQLIRETADPRGSDSALALLHFGPDLEEQVFPSAKLDEARPALLDLIGRLAGVLREPTNPPEAVDDPDPTELGTRLIAVLDEYGVDATLSGPPTVGPGWIRFRINPGVGVKVASLRQRGQELRMRLAIDSEPTIGLVEGFVTIDVPRRPPRTVHFQSCVDQLLTGNSNTGNSRLPVGVGLEGNLVLADLADSNTAHWMIAGTTGSGKSEWLRSTLAGLIVTNTPATLRLVLIDPKRTAFGWLRDSPFLARPLVFPGEDDAAEVLSDLLDEMARRDQRLAEARADDLADYVRKTGDVLPRIVCVCDEFVDLLLGGTSDRKLLEQRFQRLSGRARASGIHLILATQQPNRDIFKGALVSNLTARVCLRMPSPIESRMALGSNGAESLRGRGDLLFKTTDEPVRLQGLFLSPEDRERIGGERPT